MSASGYRTRALFLVVIALGVWVVHDAVTGTAPASVTAPDIPHKHGTEPEQLHVTLPAVPPAPLRLVVVPPHRFQPEPRAGSSRASWLMLGPTATAPASGRPATALSRPMESDAKVPALMSGGPGQRLPSAQRQGGPGRQTALEITTR